MKCRLLRRWAAFAARAALAAALASGAVWADAPSDHAVEVSAATAQAAAWLAALDHGRYDEAYNDLATVMKRGGSLDDWTSDMRAPREQLGQPVGRELQRAEFATFVRGAPTGNYVTVAYVSRFSNALPVLETVLLTLEDGRWRVAGYSAGALTDTPPPTPADTPPASATPRQ